MAHSAPDPAIHIDEPVRRGLELLMTRGVASFAVGLLAVVVTAVSADGLLHQVGHLALPGLLAFVVVARTVHVVLTRDAPPDDAVWRRVLGIARTETVMAAAVAAAVPAMWALGGIAILLRHTHHDAELGVVVGFWIPVGIILWGSATVAWLDDCRERLARAVRESERRFRTYWRNVGRAA
jgi:hypothetical protein